MMILLKKLQMRRLVIQTENVPFQQSSQLVEVEQMKIVC